MQHLIDIFAAQQKYIGDYFTANNAMSGDDGTEGLSLFTHAPWAGGECAHFYSFRAKLLRTCELADVRHADMPAIRARYEQWPFMQGIRAGMGVSEDGQVPDFRLCDVLSTHFTSWRTAALCVASACVIDAVLRDDGFGLAR